MKGFEAYFGILSPVRLIELIVTLIEPAKFKTSTRGLGRPFLWCVRSVRFHVLLCSTIFLCSLLLISTSVAMARSGFSDDKKQEELRTVHGVVVDKNDNGISSGIVYLENMKTQNVRTYITDDAGNYRFSGLDPNEDYEIHAEKGDLTSSTRTVSSFDSRRDIEIVLKLVHPKK